ncbi:hypothetical protein [Azospirillum sp. TSA2s]|uniref:hypothetical protein n=1 Tax=Azospirillum sp. TSA2s TaxID=709810 RepID=UPI00145AF24F|nr:hypothetical protein [Azospirillum sp. TSA2s]
MQGTLAKLDNLPRTQADSRPDYRLGYSHGKQAAYRVGGYIAMALVAVVCGIVAWLIG